MADSLFVGTIAASAPDYGVVLVSRGHTTLGLGDLVIAHLPYSDGQFGAVPKIAFPTGTDVLCWQNESSSHLAYVLGAANKMISDKEEYTGGNLLYHIDKFLTGDLRAFEDMLIGLIVSTEPISGTTPKGLTETFFRGTSTLWTGRDWPGCT